MTNYSKQYPYLNDDGYEAGILRTREALDKEKIKDAWLEIEKKQLLETKPSSLLVCVGNRAFFNFV